MWLYVATPVMQARGQSDSANGLLPRIARSGTSTRNGRQRCEALPKNFSRLNRLLSASQLQQ
jgi:hypothetical protein